MVFPRLVLFAIALHLIPLCGSALGQLSPLPDTKTLSEIQAWDPAPAEPEDPAVAEYVRRAPAIALPPPQRLPYFIGHLDAPVAAIAQDALQEVVLAAPKHLATLTPADRQRLVTFLQRPTPTFRKGLDRLIVGYLMGTGPEGLDTVEGALLRNKETAFSDKYAVLQAIRFLYWNRGPTWKPDRLRQSVRILVQLPEFSDLAIFDLCRMQDWSQQDQLMELRKRDGFQVAITKRAIIAYMIRSTQVAPDDPHAVPEQVARGRRHLETLKREDAEHYQKVISFQLADKLPRPKPPPRDGQRTYARVASGLSGLTIYTSAIHTIRFRPDGRAILAGIGDGSVHQWEFGSGESRTVAAHDRWCFSIAFDPRGHEMATGGGDQRVKLWRYDSEQIVALADQPAADSHTDDVHAVAFDPAGQTLYSTGDDMSVVATDRQTLKVLRRLEGHTEPIPCLAVHPSGKVIATGSRDDTVRLWDGSTGMAMHVLDAHTDDVHSVAFSPDGRWLASASYDETIKLWHVASGRLVRTLMGHRNWVFSISFHPDGEWLASGDKDGRVILWDHQTGQQLTALKRQRQVSCVAFSPDGAWLASSAPDASICLWDPVAGKLHKRFEVPPTRKRPRR